MAYQPSVDVVKVEKLAQTSWELLKRQVTLPTIIQTVNGNQFKGALGDAVSITVPGRAKARRRALRPETENDRVLTMDPISEQKFQITLTDNIYSGVPLEDEVLTMDIDDALFILRAQIEAVAEDYEQLIGEEIASAPYLPTHELAFDPDFAFESVANAAKVLDDCWVPEQGRTFLVGTELAHRVKLAKQFTNASVVGDATAQARLVRGTIGEINGYPIVVSQAVPKTEGYLFHRTAFGASTVTPAVPSGAAFGKQIVGTASGAPSMTWIKDYDFLVSRDRSLVHFYAGVNTFQDKADERVVGNDLVAAGGLLRAVKLELDPS